jgi:DHA2 family multidrug resistance protein-like MFS transporter
MGGGLMLGAAGLYLLTQVGTVDGLLVIVVASFVASLGLAPVFGLTTELIVGSAPPERAGAASGISETAIELGSALGIAIFGSIGAAVYRGELASELPSGLPGVAVDAARDTLGAAVAAGAVLPTDLGAALVETARHAFVSGMHITAAFAAAVAVGLAGLTIVGLRTHRSVPDAAASEPMATDRPVPDLRRRPVEVVTQNVEGIH